MSVEYVALVDYIAIAAEITGLDVDTLMRVAKLDLADSALHAPAAGLGEIEFYPDFVDKTAERQGREVARSAGPLNLR